MPRHGRVRKLVIAILISLAAATTACGAESGDGGGSTDLDITTADTTTSETAPDNSSQVGGLADSVCQDGLDVYRQNSDKTNPVEDQILANNTVSGTARGLEQLPDAPGLGALVDALKDYAEIGGQIAVAMDQSAAGGTAEIDALWEEQGVVGERVAAAAHSLDAPTCAQLGEL